MSGVTCRGARTDAQKREEAAMGEKHWRALFISWARLRRTETITASLGIPDCHVQYFWRGTPLPLTLLKYALQFFHTLALLLRRRPRVVFVTNPPIFAVLPVYLYAALFRARYAIDFHSGCFLQRQWRKWEGLQRFLARRAALNLAHNAANARVLEAWGAPYQVLPSLPPRLEAPAGEGKAPAPARSGRPLAVYICSFKPDEPVAAFLEAAAGIGECDFRVTGRAPEGLRARLPPNVELTGFLGDADYLALIRRADLLIALTTQDETLLYGAQEAIALHRPLLLSRSDVLGATFPEGTVFAENTPAGLRDGVREALARRAELAAAMAAFEGRYRAAGEARLIGIRAALGG
jgi:glycosyltransferase involved in cell wall biosynthesis